MEIYKTYYKIENKKIFKKYLKTLSEVEKHHNKHEKHINKKETHTSGWVIHVMEI